MMLSKKIFIQLFVVLMLCYASLSKAELTIDITLEGGKRMPIAVVPFGNESVLPQSMTKVISADLASSGVFKVIDTAGVSPLPTEPNEIDYNFWKSKAVDALVIGKVRNVSMTQSEVSFRLIDAVKQTTLSSASIMVSNDKLRASAHKISDVIYEALTGDKGVFSTRIAYVIKNGKKYELKVADADGVNEKSVITSNEPIMSPAWSPDGTQLAYVSFEKKRPFVYTQNLATGTRKVIASFKGNNSATTWSADGSQLAVALSKDNISQIYLVPAQGGGTATRLTDSRGIDTEPTFSNDGKSIAFLSDRGGTPQIYRMSANGSNVQRVTFNGSYNVSPDWSPDGKSIAFIQRESGKFRVATIELATGQVQVLTDSNLDESPSFAPNGKLILYASQSGRRGVLSVVSSDGRWKYRLTNNSPGDVREPAWGPLPRN